MYQCKICQKVVPPKVKAFRIPVETRPKKYPYREKAFYQIQKNGDKKLIDDVGGDGYETVREVTACPDCAANMRNQSE